MAAALNHHDEFVDSLFFGNDGLQRGELLLQRIHFRLQFGAALLVDAQVRHFRLRAASLRPARSQAACERCEWQAGNVQSGQRSARRPVQDKTAPAAARAILGKLLPWLAPPLGRRLRRRAREPARLALALAMPGCRSGDRGRHREAVGLTACTMSSSFAS